MNQWRYNAPPGWNDITTAPRDGTPIELQNNWGVAPHYGVCAWTVPKRGRGQPRWHYVNDPQEKSMSDGPHLSWRPYAGASTYVDPTGGAQNTPAYWLNAIGRPDLAVAAENRQPPSGVIVAPGASFSFELDDTEPRQPEKKAGWLTSFLAWVRS